MNRKAHFRQLLALMFSLEVIAEAQTVNTQELSPEVSRRMYLGGG